MEFYRLYDSDLVGDVQGVVVGSQLDVSLLLTVGPLNEKKKKKNRIRKDSILNKMIERIIEWHTTSLQKQTSATL
jgi:hypothetical protein